MYVHVADYTKANRINNLFQFYCSEHAVSHLCLTPPSIPNVQSYFYSTKCVFAQTITVLHVKISIPKENNMKFTKHEIAFMVLTIREDKIISRRTAK